MAKNEDKVFDIAKPGSSSPQTGSKPMVVGHKSSVSDPTLKDEIDTSAAKVIEAKNSKKVDATEKEPAKTEEVLTPPKKKVIRPLTDEEKSGEEDDQEEADEETVTTDPEDSLLEKPNLSKTDPVVEEKPDSSEESPEADSSNKDAKKVAANEDKTSSESTPTQAATDDAVTEPKKAKKILDSIETDEAKDEKPKEEKKAQVDVQLEREETLKRLIKSKEYALPIKNAGHPVIKQTVVSLIVALFVGVIVFSLIIDAELIETNIVLPFDFL